MTLVQLGNTGTSLLHHQRLEMAVNVVRRTSVKMKRKHPYYYLAMKVAAFITTFILFSFVGVWTDSNTLRYTTIVLAAISIAPGIISLVVMSSISIFSIFGEGKIVGQGK